MYSFQTWGLIQENEGVDETRTLLPCFSYNDGSGTFSISYYEQNYLITLRGTRFEVAFEEELGAPTKHCTTAAKRFI